MSRALLDDSAAARRRSRVPAAFLVAACSLALAPSQARATDLSEIAAAAAPSAPALVVLWTPACLVCRKSLAEIERFAATADASGVAVTTVVPANAREEARRLLDSRALTLRVDGDGGLLSASDVRALHDRPVALAIDRRGEVVAAHAGLLGAWTLDALARRTTEAEPR